jgi:hypothetical protein
MAVANSFLPRAGLLALLNGFGWATLPLRRHAFSADWFLIWGDPLSLVGGGLCEALGVDDDFLQLSGSSFDPLSLEISLCLCNDWSVYRPSASDVASTVHSV